MSDTKSLLVELLVEELPPKSLKKVGESFAKLLAEGLTAQGLAAADVGVTAFASPRRLAVHVGNVAARGEDKRETVRVMPLSVAFDSTGQLTSPASRKLASLGAGFEDLKQIRRAFEDKRIESEFLHYSRLLPGATLAEGLQRALDDTLAKLPIPKAMQYQLADGWTNVKFVRPAHGLVAVHGDQVIAVSALGLDSGRTTRGHRFEAAAASVSLRDADSYAEQLRIEGAVIASFDERRGEIVRQLSQAAAKEGLRPIDDNALLDEVTALVERPNVLLCRFDEAFLAVPPECLILTMKANQKYFPLLDANGRLTNRFLVVSNIRPDDASAVVQGNERVVRPRLADAKFFFDQDRKKTLESRLPAMDKVVYHAKLGSMGERVQRVAAIARAIGQQLGGATLAAQAEHAARLAKADLLTEMVGEFPELQGVMGGYYARHDGEPEAIAFAIEDHYKPRFAGDKLPRNEVGLVVALADKLETLVGLFGIGQTPTGDKDPFALRRHALGILRMLIERTVAADLPALVSLAQGSFAGVPGWAAAGDAVMRFFHERLTVLLREQGSTALEVDAVLGLQPARLAEVPQRLAAVRSFAGMPESAPLAAANKRITNILKKSEANGGGGIEPKLFVEEAEHSLHRALNQVAPRADALFEQRDYTASLRELAALKGPVDAFFDTVMVNADDAKLRANRLALLSALYRAMNRVADLSRLAT